MKAYKKMQKLANDLGQLHGWAGGCGLIEIWIDGQCCPHIHMHYNMPGDSLNTKPKIFHTIEPVTENKTMDEMVDEFDRQCREGLEKLPVFENNAVDISD